MVGGVSQGSEKKKASVGLFSTFRHPLEIFFLFESLTRDTD